jgi:hypothetical protein
MSNALLDVISKHFEYNIIRLYNPKIHFQKNVLILHFKIIDNNI